MKKMKYFSTLLVAALALVAVWLVWNYYMQSPWTRDGKIRAEQVSITPQVSGSIIELNVRDNQQVKAGDVLFRLDATPFRIAVMTAQAQHAKALSDMAKAKSDWNKAQSDMDKARREADRRRNLPKNFISAEDLDTVNNALKTATANAEAAKASVAAAKASADAANAALEHANWQLAQTDVKAPVDGWVTNLSTRTGDYAAVGHPVFALVDSHSFYVVGYFEETKLRHIRPGGAASVVLYSNGQTLQGHVGSIGRAISDQSVGPEGSLIADVKPTIPWVRLAQRVPVRIEFDKLPEDIILVAGTTCTVSIGGQ
ncbi:HlyD family secretion protein [Scandinavium sp. V105_16]|uniref:HlyD family secretion protein n=1 Tax=Scandinavium lactucae TaxID=3095028 RepID=A0AAJ2SCQ0_9ENTR|nr:MULTISPECIES: HlyD family secretion protein [unclassified Scandinavium]MDX6022034.1 HlyD family secretion protein [Scandinavium sp. V105_16]MDX6034124.1 HlyD family secretion protein [Scandinavium sp. V105_12]